jgi:hypothetical protein
MQLHFSMGVTPCPPSEELQPASRAAAGRAVPVRKLPELYYLQNFRAALESIKERYPRLLSEAELAFLHGFARLPEPSQCLLTRMLMRKGALFRNATLYYPEVGALDLAISSLTELGWLDTDPLLTLEELSLLLSREEWRRTFRSSARRRDSDEGMQLALPINAELTAPRPLSQWDSRLAGTAVQLTIEPTASRLRWLYFGNDWQTWAEFVLTDLGVKKYEEVPFDAQSCAFRSREEIEHFYRLHQCRARLRAEEPASSILEHSHCPDGVADWLQAQFGLFQLRIGECLERQGCYDLALEAYRRCATAEGHIGVVRLAERAGLHADARDEALSALTLPGREGHREAIGRALGRLGRRLGEKVTRAARPKLAVMELTVPRLSPQERVERRACAELSTPASPAFYVENSLFPSLFGLLCWEAIFEPVPGAFFHPFQTGPADLYTPEFRSRRSARFASLLGLLDSSQYVDVIQRHYRDKAGLSSSFVRWGRLKPQVLSLALSCIPPTHLKLVFERFLADLEDNCSGLPDLVQFWPDERRYRLIEVKAPGDRLQYNQRRWMEFFTKHDMPAAICNIAWGEVSGGSHRDEEDRAL